MRMCIIGGGNIGTLLAAEFAQKPWHEVTVFTSRPEHWSDTIEVYAPDDALMFCSKRFCVTGDLREAVHGADYVWVTLPAFTFPEFAQAVTPLLAAGQRVICVPGSGGAEFAFAEAIRKGCVLGGLQRVHSIARLKEYGASVYMLGRKSAVQLATIPAAAADVIAADIEAALDMPCEVLSHYLSVTLTPSNPILHTSRLYSMFRDYTEGVGYDHRILFYEEWTDDASELLLACDEELQNLCRALAPLDLSAVRSLRLHYESDTAEAMTRKIRSIAAFRGLIAPMCRTQCGWIPDFSSRYFTADFSYGLKVLLDIGELFGVEMSQMREIWEWYRGISETKNYFSIPVSDRAAFCALYPENIGA